MIAPIDPAEVEQRLKNLIAKHKGKNITVAEIKRRIFEAGGEDLMKESNLFLKWWIGCFRKPGENSLNELLQAFQDAWNCFPHGSLNGKSPQQMAQEEMKKHPEMMKGNNRGSMPDITVGGTTMSWDDHKKMIKKMEKMQQPFKHWIEEVALPAYKDFLGMKFKSKKTIEKHYDVADRFCHRALFVGFLDFEQIRPAFAVWEFPDWWPSHILYSNLNEDQVWASLCDFLWFAEFKLDRSIPGVWEEASDEGGEECTDVNCPHCGSSNVEPIPEKTGRNEPCPCGSGKKYKKCCGK